MARARGRQRTQIKIKFPALTLHQKGPRHTTIKGDALPEPWQLGLGSKDEVKAYMALRKAGVPFRVQVNFDGGADVMGGQRADFELTQFYPSKILEILGPRHDLPGQMLRDQRKWDRRRQEGHEVITVRTDEPDFENAILEAVGHPVLV